MNKKLHIISWDIPFPADYGGVIDVFYTLKSLHKVGVDIILHCFQYGDRLPQNELKKHCSKVYYYTRITGFRGLDATLPYIVSSRKNNELLYNLLQDESPILFEGIHSTFLLNHPKLKGRKKILRAQNVEQDYYKQLAENTNEWKKRLYYYFEANRLKKYESLLNEVDLFLTVAKHDELFFKKMYPTKQHQYIPSFQAFETVVSKSGKGSYCLYHGNLSVAENQKAALFLIQEVFSGLNIPLIIAGKNPSQELLNLQGATIQIIASPSDLVLNDLIANAHINILPSFQTTGLKLKLLHALFAGRYCLCNEAMLVGTGLDQTVLIANSSDEFKRTIPEIMAQEFEEDSIQKRTILLASYSTIKNAHWLTTQL